MTTPPTSQNCDAVRHNVNGVPVTSIWDRPEDWVLVRCLPGGRMSPWKNFFELEELEGMAEQIKEEKEASKRGKNS